MEKRCESGKRFGKEGTAARNAMLEGFMRDKGGTAYAMARSLAGNEEEAGELVQEALYRVARAWGRFESSKALEPWFFAVLRNAFRDRQRRAERRAISLDWLLDAGDFDALGDAVCDGGESIEAYLEREETGREVRRALRALSETERTVLQLCDMEGRSYDDVARRLGIPLGTVRSRIFRARQALRTRWPNLAALAR